MAITVSYELNAPNVASETIDEEAVVIHLGRGSYFSIRGLGCFIWTLLLDGENAATIVGRVVGNYPGQAGAAANVSGFIDTLLLEDLIRPRASLPAEASRSALQGLPATYAAPVLEKFTDMEALLLLDPIHDVNEQGWPNRPNT